MQILFPLPYSPELNPVEQLWDVLKDGKGFANALVDSIKDLRASLLPGMRRFWEDPDLVLTLIGGPWLHLKANSLLKIYKSSYLGRMV